MATAYQSKRGSPRLSAQISRSDRQNLMAVQAQYARLRADFVIIAKHFVTSDILTELVNEYANKIDSKRKLDNINDIEDLIEILEKRDVLNYDNLELFHLVAKRYCNDTSVYTLLINYEKWLDTVPPAQRCNMYLIGNDISIHMQPKHETCDQINQSHQNTSGTYSANLNENENCPCRKHPGNNESRSDNKEEKLIQDVLLKLSERLGHGWRDVTRFMNIRESQIDEIENKYPSSLKEQSYQALKLCISQYDPNAWKVPLLRGLRKGRRNDLKEMLEDLVLVDN